MGPFARILAFATLGALITGNTGAAEATKQAALRQEAYVWQRAWNNNVRQAISERSTNFSCIVVLAAEIGWDKNVPKLVRVPLDFDLLSGIAADRSLRGCDFGLALRIGSYPGPFSATNAAGQFIIANARSIVSEALAHKVPLRELQIDFDCAASKLAGYRVWIEAIRRATTPVKVIVTTLPNWLGRPELKELVTACDGYVLQVHSLEAPKDATALLSLCDPGAAKRAVEQAGKLGVPFTVALPTYGYFVAFNREGRFAGISAEGPSKQWPPGTHIRELMADPVQMSTLVQTWSTNRPAAMEGIIWYRLPVAGDILNWRWPTLGAIIQTRSPRESLRVESCRVESGLTEINLVNDGELDISSRLAIEARWQNARLLAGDALRGFELVDAGSSAVTFQNQSRPGRLPAGEKVAVGWLRLSEDREVQVELKR